MALLDQLFRFRGDARADRACVTLGALVAALDQSASRQEDSDADPPQPPAPPAPIPAPLNPPEPPRPTQPPPSPGPSLPSDAAPALTSANGVPAPSEPIRSAAPICVFPPPSYRPAKPAIATKPKAEREESGANQPPEADSPLPDPEPPQQGVELPAESEVPSVATDPPAGEASELPLDRAPDAAPASSAAAATPAFVEESRTAESAAPPEVIPVPAAPEVPTANHPVADPAPAAAPPDATAHSQPMPHSSPDRPASAGPCLEDPSLPPLLLRAQVESSSDPTARPIILGASATPTLSGHDSDLRQISPPLIRLAPVLPPRAVQSVQPSPDPNAGRTIVLKIAVDPESGLDADSLQKRVASFPGVTGCVILDGRH